MNVRRFKMLEHIKTTIGFYACKKLPSLVEEMPSPTSVLQQLLSASIYRLCISSPAIAAWLRERTLDCGFLTQQYPSEIHPIATFRGMVSHRICDSPLSTYMISQKTNLQDDSSFSTPENLPMLSSSLNNDLTFVL